ncbi:hypothetical protein AB3Y40_06640 [Yoonia sp. R2331]|uniref:hypothetical protein n=1 Tax=Yoonia sp. R2331 TaxID=3237238 RepID=UPI0034E50455
MPKKESTLNKIIMTRTKLGLWVNYGDVALDGQEPQEFAAEVKECFDALMDFRNIVSAMASLEGEPKDRAREFLEL